MWPYVNNFWGTVTHLEGKFEVSISFVRYKKQEHFINVMPQKKMLLTFFVFFHYQNCVGGIHIFVGEKFVPNWIRNVS